MTNPYQSPDGEFSGDETQNHPRHEGPDYDEAREYWPTCPECGKRLTITCPFCKTTDDLFPLGDTEYWDDDLGGSLVEYQKRIDRQYTSRSVLFGEGDTSMPLDEHHCSCNKPAKTPFELLYGGSRPEPVGGRSCCGKHGHDCHADDLPDEYDDEYNDAYDDGYIDEDYAADEAYDDDEDLPERDYDSESLPFVVICPTCSEAFIPSFPGGCNRCHYVWDRSKPLDAEEAVTAHKKVANPALKEIGGFSPWQLIVGLVVLGILIAVCVAVMR